MSLGSDLWVLMSVTDSIQDYFADLTDVTLADEDSNSIPADDVNRAILGNVAMQVAPPGAKIETNASGTTWWRNLQLIQEAPTVDQIYN